MSTQVVVKEIICKACKHIFGDFRKRCPACGHERSWREMSKQQPPAPLHRRRRARDNDCIFCERKGATEVCPHCSERIHKTCLSLHARMCEKFQITRLQAACEHTFGEPPIDVCPKCGARRE